MPDKDRSARPPFARNPGGGDPPDPVRRQARNHGHALVHRGRQGAFGAAGDHYDGGVKLVMTLMVRNEVDVIEANLEYHLAQGVDFVIVTDHGSEDGTSEILREYERIGVAKIIRDEGEGYHQSNRVTRMAEIARTGHGADWVIHNDADEFWWPLVGDLRDVFSSLPPCFGQIEVRRRNFRPPADGEGPFYSRLVHREASSFNLLGHPLEPKVAHRPHREVVVATGNHSISGADLSAVPAGEVLEIFHFPMRSYEQFERRVVQAGHALEQLPDRPPLVGRDQLALLQLHRAGKLRDYYDGLVLDRAALERGLQLGAVVVDRRLEDFMRGLRSGERSRVRPDAPFAGALLRRLMDALGEIHEGRTELGRALLAAEAELAGARDQVAQLSAGEAEAKERAIEQAEALRRSEQGLRDFENRLRRAERTIDDVTRSLSWRLTGPLRGAKRLLGGE
jgi:Glycosyl transferase family 2